jgi:hypothetical protein
MLHAFCAAGNTGALFYSERSLFLPLLEFLLQLVEKLACNTIPGSPRKELLAFR